MSPDVFSTNGILAIRLIGELDAGPGQPRHALQVQLGLVVGIPDCHHSWVGRQLHLQFHGDIHQDM